jgi:hypothetical protein
MGFVVVALAFAGGVELRLSSGDDRAVPPKAARSLDGGAAFPRARLLRVDPGALPRPRSTPTATPTASPVLPGVAPPAAPVQTPPPPPVPTGGTFDSTGDAAPEQNRFDSDG